MVLSFFATLFWDKSFWFPFATLLAFFIAMWIWTRAFRIIINEDRLIYSTLFSKNNTTRFADIKKLEIRVGLYKNTLYRLNIYDNNRFSTAPLIINMKPFSERGLAILINTITTANPSVEVDDEVKKLKRGYFEPISYRVLKKLCDSGAKNIETGK